VAADQRNMIITMITNTVTAAEVVKQKKWPNPAQAGAAIAKMILKAGSDRLFFVF
jgi:hypothetical protein